MPAVHLYPQASKRRGCAKGRTLQTLMVTTQQRDAKEFAHVARVESAPTSGRRCRVFPREVSAGGYTFTLYVAVVDIPTADL